MWPFGTFTFEFLSHINNAEKDVGFGKANKYSDSYIHNGGWVITQE